MRRFLLLSAPIAVAIAMACGGSDNVDVGGESGGDGGGSDSGSTRDGRVGNPGDGSTTPVTWSDITDGKNWSFYDLGLLYPSLDGAPSPLPSGFLGAIFDGHYVYYVPTGNKTGGPSGTSQAYDVVRFDTTAPFTVGSSYEKMSIAALGANAAFVGGTIGDGKIYFAPYQAIPFIHYDTSLPFADGGGLGGSGSSAGASFGAIFANHAVYYAPLTATTAQRIDALDGGIGTFSLFALDASAPAYQGVAFDGKYAYYAPAAGGSPTPTNLGEILRVDTTADFGNAASWSSFDTQQVDPATGDFAGTAFDGRYVYFVPTTTGAGMPVSSRFVRFDTTGTFNDPGAWKVFVPTNDASSTGYHTAGFDGRYIYFLPFVTTGTSLLLRYDTTMTFGDSASWTYFPMDTFRPDATGFEGMAFDGTYMYFVPRYGHVAARFNARSPAGLPPGYSGSFL